MCMQVLCAEEALSCQVSVVFLYAPRAAVVGGGERERNLKWIGPFKKAKGNSVAVLLVFFSFFCATLLDFIVYESG